jgi:hypothetical protein
MSPSLIPRPGKSFNACKWPSSSLSAFGFPGMAEPALRGKGANTVESAGENAYGVRARAGTGKWSETERNAALRPGHR